MRQLYHASRRGSAYVFVLGAATLIATAGILATVLQRQRLARQTDMTTISTVDREHASAVEFAQSLIAVDPSGLAWRPFRKVEIHAAAMLDDPEASHWIMLTDPVDDELITVNLADPVRVTVDSIVGAARRKTRFDLAFTLEPLPALQHALITSEVEGAGTLTLTGTQVEATTRPQLDADYAASAEVGVSPEEFRIAATVMSSVPAEPVPAPAEDLFAYYQSIGTVIELSAAQTFDRVLFSPASNPAGTGLNARGIYVINANDKKLRITNTRVLGTLVILNASPASEIGPDVSISPASSDLPAMLVRGSMRFQLENADLRENDVARNLNPAGAPYLGVTDSDMSDAYPARIRGLVYVSNNVVIHDHSTFEGVLWVGGTTDVRGNRTLSVRWAPLTDPIPGFSRVSSMRVANEGVVRVAP